MANRWLSCAHDYLLRLAIVLRLPQQLAVCCR
jgi:hypothetical protein